MLKKLAKAIEDRVKKLVDGREPGEEIRPDIKVMARSYLGHLNKYRDDLLVEVRVQP